jgi:hypothetical protein
MTTKYHSTQPVADVPNRDRILNSTCAIRGRWLALGFSGSWLTLILALLPISVEARCPQGWDVSDEWKFQQDGPLIITVNLRQDRAVITGTASFFGLIKKGEGSSFGETGLIHGTVDGTLEGDQFDVKIYWGNNTIGVYQGTVRPSGRIEGKGWEQRSRRTKVNWHSIGVMKCVDEKAVQPTNPTPKPIKKTGNIPASPTPKPIKSSGKAKTSAAVPFINANPKAVKIPAGQSQATTNLTWDAGPDHPDAEVWIRESGGEETLVVQQGKGTRNVTVENKVYRVMLKDAGQELAVTAFFGTTP